MSKLDGDNLDEFISPLLQARELHDNPFPPSDVRKRWSLMKRKLKNPKFKLKFTTVKDIK